MPIRMRLRGALIWSGLAVFCALLVEASAQTFPPLPGFQYQPTVPDVDPGIDHGNSGATLPEEFQKRMVFYRSQQLPGTVMIYTGSVSSI